MHLNLLGCVLLLSTLAVDAAPTLESRHGPLKRHHEMSHEHRRSWKRDFSARGDHSIQLSIKLHAHDQKRVDAVIKDLLDPESPNHRQWLSPQEAAELTAPHPDTVESLMSYLGLNLVDFAYDKILPNNRSITFTTTIAKANELFNANYGYHSTKRSDGMMIRNMLATPSYDIPAHLHSKIAFIDPGTSLATNVKHSSVGARIPYHQEREFVENVKREREEHEAMKREESKRLVAAATALTRGAPPAKTTTSTSTQVAALTRGPAIPVPPQASAIAIILPGPSSPVLSSNLANCGSQTNPGLGPNCLRALYHIPSPPTSPATSVGALNLRPYFSNSTNLQYGYARIASNIPSNYLPTHVDITTAGTLTAIGSDSAEPDGDLQTLVPLVYPMQVYDFEGSNLNANAIFDAVSQMGTGSIPRPDVLSVSYGFGEYDSGVSGVSIRDQYCPQTDPQVLMGTTLICSSGDNGGQDMQYPALCPNWLSVGASQILSGNTVTALQVAENTVGTFGYKGSGGFSQYSATNPPSYQSAAIAAYNAQYADPTYSVYQGNAATPDISAQGRDILFGYWTQQYGSGLYLFAGTSASSPVVGALMAVLNAQLKANGKNVVGNPLTVFYQNSATLFRDLVSGDNTVSNSGAAWPTKNGWDPVTGLGTPIFDRIFAYYNK